MKKKRIVCLSCFTGRWRKLSLIMRNFIILFFILNVQVTANVLSQPIFSLKLENVSLKTCLKAIEEETGVGFLYSGRDIEKIRNITVNADNEKLSEILDEILLGNGFTYQIKNNVILITKAPAPMKPIEKAEVASQQIKVISGKVTDEKGDPLPGVNIVVRGNTTIGTITDLEGKYTLEIPVKAENLEFSFIGMVSQSVSIGNSAIINVTLKASTEGLSEVVVTALGIQRQQKALGFASQEIGEADLSGARESSISNALAGKAAGVRVTKTAGGTGGSTSVVIRGAKSLLGNNQPLYVVDGLPITNIGHSSGGLDGDTDTGDGIGDINSEDIESISILKGPSASALYGSRGSNGVVLITTKSGLKKKGIGVEINSNTSFENINLIPERQNKYSTGYGTYVGSTVAQVNGQYYPVLDNIVDNWGPPLDGTTIVVDPYVFPGEAPRTMALVAQPEDNLKNFYQTGLSTNNTAALSGSNDKTTARISLGHSTNEGIIPNWNMNKQTVSLSANSKITDYLSFTGKFSYIRDEGNNRPYLGAGGNNVCQYLMYMSRYIPMPFLKEYYERTKTYGSFPGIIYNPYYIVNELKNNDVKDRYIGQVAIDLKLNSWLSILGRVGSDQYSHEEIKKWPVGARGSDFSTGRLTNTVRIVKDINADLILTANKNVTSDLNINGIVGASLSNHNRQVWIQNGYSFKAPGIYNISNCKTINNSEYLVRKEIQSVYFTGQTGYKNYLFLDITGRNDWSSTLGINNYSFFYPSVSTSLVITDAIKSIPSDILTFGKVRASWAQVGNDSDPYLTSNGYALTTDTYGDQNLSYMNSQLPLVNLKNELTESWEIGADLRFYQNRMGIDFTYYNGKTTNQIVPMNVSVASGYTNTIINAGEIQNKGLELVLNLNPVKTNGGFKWDINFNYSKNNSKVVELGPGIQSLTLATSSFAGITEARVGRPYGEIIGYAYKRAPDGQKIVNDLGYYSATSDKKVIGNITPDWTGGLNNTFSFKGFTLNLLLDFVQGGNVMSNTMYILMGKGLAKFTLEGRQERLVDENGVATPYVGILDGVKEVKDASGNITYVKNDKAVSGMDYWAQRAWGNITEEFVLDGSYISLREIMLSYKFSPSLLKNTPISGLSISAIGRNLFYLEEHMKDMGISPESSPNTSAGAAGIEMYTFPSTRSLGFNVKINF